jgi:hypothetical protein
MLAENVEELFPGSGPIAAAILGVGLTIGLNRFEKNATLFLSPTPLCVLNVKSLDRTAGNSYLAKAGKKV